MKTFTITDIRSFNPCYDPVLHLAEDWAGTALDMLQHPTIPAIDKTWLCRRYEVMNSKGLRLFAADCAERAQTYPKNYTPDPRTLAAIQAARDFANGLISESVLVEHRKNIPDYADKTAAYAAYAANAAAYAANAAANAATDANADTAAGAGAANTAYTAAYSGADVAENKERQLQVDYLIRMYLECPDHFVGEDK